MAKTKVAIIRCESYDEKIVFNAIKKGIDLIGGIDSIVKKNEKILLKVNNLVGSNPEKAVTTHPSILNAMIEILLEKNIKITYGDSPGFEKPLVGLTKSGHIKIGDKYNIKMGDFEKGKSIDFPKGVICKKFNIANACLESDGIISLAKMKTHGLTRITGAVKNQLGCVYGLHKSSFHVRFPNPTNFSKMLIDLNNLLKPRLYILDGVLAMEGNGPQGGEPIKMNCIIISTDPVAVDATFSKMINLNPIFVPTIKYGKIYGIGTYLENEIEYVGEPIEKFINKDFKVIRKPVVNSLLKPFMFSAVRNIIYPKPVINNEKCVKCGVCVNSCPVEGKALNFKDNNKKEPPVYNYKKCIRCYCCQEMCPNKAIYLKQPFLSRLFKRTKV
jgi:uncharacterized protein (DUF362 family)/ferredoxin